MDNASALSAADVALLTGDGNNGTNSLFWIFALLILAGGGFGFGGYGGRTQTATTDELSAGFNFAGVNNKLNEIGAGIAGVNQNLGNAICQSTYELASKIDACCCSTKEAIGQVRYDMAVQYGDLKSLIQSVAQQNKIESLQAQVYQLQMDKAICGIPKVNPYAWGVTPMDNCNHNPYFC